MLIENRGVHTVIKQQARDRPRVQAALHERTPAELKELVEAEHRGRPFLLWRAVSGAWSICELDGREHITLGRRSSNDVVIADDSEVSRTHAELELVGEDWTVRDDGLSRNGTYVNATRISQRRRLQDGDLLRVGHTVLEFRDPGAGSTAVTSSGSLASKVDGLSETQRRVLVALCRPCMTADAFATPASNSEIALEVFLSVDAVKNHLRILFKRFEIEDLPQNQKRARLAQCALRWGLVSERKL